VVKNKEQSSLEHLQKIVPQFYVMNQQVILDSKTSEDILKLLYEISQDKLVIIVTHNYEEVEKYVTRRIKMSDGEIIEDIDLEPKQKLD
jgi:energy-coupling factor transporter ATP-binding protein EcfA2